MKPAKKFEKKATQVLRLEKGKSGIVRMLFGRTGIVSFLLLVQVIVLFNIFRFLETLIPYAFISLAFLTLLMVVHIINTESNMSIKLSWIILIMLIPGFGGLLYLFIEQDIGHRRLRELLKAITKESKKEFERQDKLMGSLKVENAGLYNLATYTGKIGGFPIYEKSAAKYFPSGEAAFLEILAQLSSAKKYIFLEFYIIAEGDMWGQILKILADKVQEGVEVRVMYDGTCEFSTLPYSYRKKIEELGIMCKVFSPIRPFISTHYNYRDHRKILVIDGLVAFTGGINLADEYINKIEVYGHWKDTAIMISGDAVDSFTLMFLQMWNIGEKDRAYITSSYACKPLAEATPGYILPFGDSPLDNDRVGEMIYMDILSTALRYVHIMTPYLILDGEMLIALQFAAKRGIDVKIIMPHIPDKKLVFALSRNHYKELIDAGVQIYEYTPGFMHAKAFLSDDLKAVVGTINLDYRSLYHHFECAVYMEAVPAVLDIERDFNETLQLSHKISLEDIKKFNIFMTLIGKFLKLIAPLM